MASDEKGNKGIKRKSEESAKGSPNKHVCPGDGGSTSTGITHAGQAQGNVREINWMESCTTNKFGANPQCAICNEYHPFCINSSTFKDHYRDDHPLIDTEENEESEWIFLYFEPFVADNRYLRCRICESTFEVLEFKGPFIEHFDEAHDKIAKRRRQQRRDNEDAEEVKRRLTRKFVLDLYTAFVDKETVKGNENKKKYEKSEEDARQEAWWMKYVRRVESYKVFCGITNCPNFKKNPILVYLHGDDFESHVQSHQPEVTLRRNVDIWKYLSFDNNFLVRCTRCNKFLTYTLHTHFVRHLREKHKIKPPGIGGESSQKTNDEVKINEHIKTLMEYLIENYYE